MARAARTADGLTQKQATFVAEYLKSGNASAAYRIAYNAREMLAKTVHKRAGELLRNGVIAGCITRQQKRLRERTEITLESLTLALVEDREAAREDRQHGAAIAATKALIELHGFKADPRASARMPVERLTDEELDLAIAKAQRQIAEGVKH